MNYPKPAFMIEDELPSLSPVQTMVKMFEHTNKEGYLSIPEWPYDDKDYDEPDMYYLCKMNWSQEDLKNVIEDFRKLEERIKTIKDEDPLQSIILENRDLVPFSDMQLEIPDLMVLKEAKRPATYNVAIRAMRLCMLYAMDAPDIITNNEAQLLAQALVINHFAESIQPFNCYDAAAVECMKEIIHNVDQDAPLVGIFWYDTEKEELFGVHNSFAGNNPKYRSYAPEIFHIDVTTDSRTHRSIWEKESKKGKDKRFAGEYENTPRGRVIKLFTSPFKPQNGTGYAVFSGEWIKDHPSAKTEILREFQLPEDTAFYDTGDELELIEADLTWNEIGYCDTLVRAIFGPANYVIDYSGELLDQIEENVSSLPKEEKDVIEKLFRTGESLELFAATEGIDPEEAEVRKSTALRKLRHPRNSGKLKPFVHYIEER